MLESGEYPEYRSAFAARRAIVLSAVNAGWTLDDCQRAFAANGLWHSTSGERAERRVRRDYEAASRHADANPSFRFAEDARQYIGLVTAEVEGFPWRGVSGRVDRDVMLCVCRRATRVACTAINVSVRDAATGAGVTKATAARSLQRLVSSGWLIKTGEREFHLAQGYRITREVNGSETYEPLRKVLRITCLRNAHPDHEVWQRLGKPAMQLWSVLDVGPQSARALARAATVAQDTARRNLPRLAEVGLAVLDPDGWRVGRLSPDQVQAHQGWVKEHSLSEYRKQDVADDRAHFKAWHGLDGTGTEQSEDGQPEWSKEAAPITAAAA